MELKVTLEGNKKVSTHIGDHLIMTDQPEKQGIDSSGIELTLTVTRAEKKAIMNNPEFIVKTVPHNK